MSETEGPKQTLSGSDIVERAKKVLHEGNVRRVVVKNDDKVVAEFPLTVGVGVAVLAPVVAALGAIVALATNCSIEIEKDVEDKGQET